MDTKSKVLFFIFILMILAVVGVVYYRYVILRDYYMQAQVECDPQTEKCFMTECDPADDSECPANPDERVSYYKIIEKKAYAIPLCDPTDKSCPPLTCAGDLSCHETFCDENNLGDGEACAITTDTDTVAPDVTFTTVDVSTSTIDITSDMPVTN